MIKVSKILIAAGAWVHVWMDPEGNTHDAGESHANWAVKNVLGDEGIGSPARLAVYQIMFGKGWTRLGNYYGTAYVNGKSITDRKRFDKIQIWVMNQEPNDVAVELEEPSYAHTFTYDEFVSAKSVPDLISIGRGDKVASRKKADWFWLHFWMEPDGTLHDAKDHHGVWAARYLKSLGQEVDIDSAYEAMFAMGWVRLGWRAECAYVEAAQINNKILFGKVQSWVEDHPGSEVRVDIQSPKISLSFEFQEFTSASNVASLYSMTEIGV